MFEFDTKEQREAWPIIRDILKNTFPLGESHAHMQHRLDMAASRFDEREKTCGIEFGSYAYGLLVIAQHVGLNQFNLRMPTLDRFLDSVGILNDEGREVLAQVNANAMCKVEK